MKPYELTKTIHNINKTLFWQDFTNREPEEKRAIEKYHMFKYLEGDELTNAIERIKKFDINKVWDKSFWQIGVNDSICAVASELSQNIERIKAL